MYVCMRFLFIHICLPLSTSLPRHCKVTKRCRESIYVYFVYIIYGCIYLVCIVFIYICLYIYAYPSLLLSPAAPQDHQAVPWVYLCMYIFIYIYICIYMYIYIYIYICVCVCVCMLTPSILFTPAASQGH